MNITQMIRVSQSLVKRSALVLAALMVAGSMQAATATFTNIVAGTYDWTVAGNWDAGGVPASATTATNVFFKDIGNALGGGVTVNNDPATLTLNTLTLNGLAKLSTATAFTLGTAGKTWTLDGTAPKVNLNAMNNGSGVLTIRSNPNLTLNTDALFIGSGTATFLFPGVISGGGFGFTKVGGSTLTLNGAAVNT